MTPKPALKLVDVEPIDITLELRKEIEARDWARVHVAGDRAKPLPFFERVRRTWIR
jgi:hypothetical protein